MEIYVDDMKLIMYVTNLDDCRDLQHNTNCLSNWYGIKSYKV